MVIGMLIPRSGEDFVDRPLNVLSLDWTLVTAAKASGPAVSLVWCGPGNDAFLLLLPLCRVIPLQSLIL